MDVVSYAWQNRLVKYGFENVFRWSILRISGTTWTMDILYWLLNGSKAGRERTENMDDIFLHVELGYPGEPPNLDTIKEQTSPRKIKTHLKVDFFRRFLDDRENCPKFIVIMRDIRDCMVSHYHFIMLLKFLKFDFPFDDFLAMQAANRIPFGDPIDYNLGWWAYKDHPRVFIVHYEDMLRNAKAAVKSLGEFINRPVDGATAAEIAEGCSFVQMRERAATYQKAAYDDKKSFFRKGEEGDWKNYFSDEQAHRFDYMIKEKCHPKGLYMDK